MEQILILSDQLKGDTALRAWGVLLAVAFLGWLFLWAAAHFMSRNRIRPLRVIVQARSVLVMIAIIFIFDLIAVPVVLVHLNGAALLCLGVCAGIALLYLISVNDQDLKKDNDPFP